MLAKIKGVIISEIPYKESSKIINVFTSEGIIGIIAKGAYKPKSIYVNLTSKLTYGIFHINKRVGLSSLIEVDVVDSLKNIKKDLYKISYASFITDLSVQVYNHDNDSKIYDLYIASLLKINDGFDPLVISNILELKLLDFLGIRPIIDKCSVCGNSNDIVTISSYKGGYVCKNCLNNDIIVNVKTIKLIRMFYYVDIAKISKLDISDNIKEEINRFLDLYYDRYSGLYLKTKEFLNKLNNFQEVIVLSDYKYIIIPILTVIISQVIKAIIETIHTRKFSLERLFNGSGGMPSSHSSLVISLLTLIFIDFGVDSIYFAICLIFGLIVLYDAMGIRYEKGKQAEVLNEISRKIDLPGIKFLKEKIGHKPIEVLGGIITGILLALILNNFF